MRKPGLLFLLFIFALRGAAFAATDTWLEVRSPQFTVVTNADEKQALHVADQFERMRAVFQTLFPTSKATSGTPITVIALRSKKDFLALEPTAYLAKGQLALAGWFQRTEDKNFIVLRLDAEGAHPFATVYHEYTHSLMSSAADWMPLWLNEGLAEFYQNTDIHDKYVELGEPSAEDILYLRQNRLLPLTTLFTVDANSPYYHEEQKGSEFYAESWAITHYLEIKDREANTHRLQDYVVLMSQHVDSLTAAQKAFGDLNQLQKELQWYIAQGSFKLFKMQAATVVDDRSFKVTRLSLPEADAVRGDFMAHTERLKDARVLLDGVLRSDPNNVLAHEAMGLVEFREGNREAARKWYGEAVKLDSQNYLAHYYYAAMTQMTDAEGDAKEIETSLRAAIKLNPSFAPAYDRLATFYAQRHEKLEEAYALNLHAVALDPGNVHYRLHAATLMMERDRPEDAIRVLHTADASTKSKQEAQMIQNQLDSIQQYLAARSASGPAEPAGAGSESAGAVKTETHVRVIEDGQVRSEPLVKTKPAGNGPKHPSEEAHGPMLTATGVIAAVNCTYPTVIDIQLQSGEKKMSFYNNNFYKIEFSALNYTPQGEIHPCTDLEGKKARVQYAKVTDASTDGQIVAIELSR